MRVIVDIICIVFAFYKFLKELKNCSLLGAVEGSDSLEERLRSSKETASRPLAGIEYIL
jgi:hypothetical protein